jgi:hypothetical protein
MQVTVQGKRRSLIVHIVKPGMRLRPRFFEALARASIVKAKPLMFSLPLNKCALLRWVDSHSPVFFDQLWHRATRT